MRREKHVAQKEICVVYVRSEKSGRDRLSGVLQMLGIPVPPEMTTPSLLAGKEPWSKTALNV